MNWISNVNGTKAVNGFSGHIKTGSKDHCVSYRCTSTGNAAVDFLCCVLVDFNVLSQGWVAYA